MTPNLQLLSLFESLSTMEHLVARKHLRKYIAASKLVAMYLFHLCRLSLSFLEDSSPLVRFSEAHFQQNTMLCSCISHSFSVSPRVLLGKRSDRTYTYILLYECYVGSVT